jgi:hypothetical protein
MSAPSSFLAFLAVPTVGRIGPELVLRLRAFSYP